MLEDRDYQFREFQPIPGYRDASTSPIAIATTTNDIFDLLLSGALPDGGQHAKNYLETQTLRFLSRVEQASRAYVGKGEYKEELDPETREAFDLSKLTFGHMRDQVIPGTDITFARTGMLRPPENMDEFIARLNELGTTVRRFIRGAQRPPQIQDPTSAFFRTRSFFTVAHSIPFQEPSSNPTNS